VHEASISYLPSPDLPVLEIVESFLVSYVLFGYMVTISLDTSQHKRLIFWGQELALPRKLWYSWPACHADQDGNTALDDKDPVLRISYSVEEVL
jgi:hypothetical protein